MNGDWKVLKTKIRTFALYLPQFHPIPENDQFWGAGFTEWTNVARARPLYRGHVQPQLPGELGFYDLRLAETRIQQARLARSHGIEAFLYWHYWFAGRRVLERPFNEMLASGVPDFPFCLGWANHTWAGVWIGADDDILIEQTYPGVDDYKRHFDALLPAFLDPRYVRIAEMPVFLVFRPMEIPDPLVFCETWRERANAAGLKGIHLIGVGPPWWRAIDFGFDAVVPLWVPERSGSLWRRIVNRLPLWLGNRLKRPTVYQYQWYADRSVSRSLGKSEAGWEYASLMPNWDNTPRSGTRGVVLEGSTPELFGEQVRRIIEVYEENQVEQDNRILVLKSWNEWAEGNFMEPSMAYGRRYLEVFRDVVIQSGEDSHE